MAEPGTGVDFHKHGVAFFLNKENEHKMNKTNPRNTSLSFLENPLCFKSRI